MLKVLHGLNNRQQIPFEDHEREYNVLARRCLCYMPLDASIVSSAPDRLRRNVVRNRMSRTTWKTTMLQTFIKNEFFFLMFHICFIKNIYYFSFSFINYRQYIITYIFYLFLYNIIIFLYNIYLKSCRNFQ